MDEYLTPGLALWPVSFVHKMSLIDSSFFLCHFFSLVEGQREIKMKVDDKTSIWRWNTEYYSQIISHNLHVISSNPSTQPRYRLHSIATFVLESHQQAILEKKQIIYKRYDFGYTTKITNAKVVNKNQSFFGIFCQIWAYMHVLIFESIAPFPIV